MSQTTNTDIETLKQMRLPELRARFAEVVGETSKSPNKTFLARRIVEALATQPAETAELEPAEASEQELAEAAPEGPQPADTPSESSSANRDKEAQPEATSGDDAHQETPLTKLSIPELQARYREVIQRETGSSNRGYLIWKIRQAQKGSIPVGPRRQRAARDAGDFKVLPLRMEADLVARLDEARERLGLKSRMELFRRSLHFYMDNQGEAEVAALFMPEA